MTATEEWWGVAEAASHCGIPDATWRSYVSRGTAPPPDLRIGRTPAWRPSTVRGWHADRPGKGGRPRKVTHTDGTR